MAENKKNKKPAGPMHTISFLITDVERYRYPRNAFNGRFYMMWKIHNQLVKEAKKRLSTLFCNKRYRILRQKYHKRTSEEAAVKKKIDELNNKILEASEETEKDEAQIKSWSEKVKKLELQYIELDEKRKTIGTQLSDIQKSYGLYNRCFYHWALPLSHKYRKHLSSQQIQKECDRVWTAVSTCLYGGGEQIHFQKLDEFKSISQKVPTNGVKFNPWKGEGIWNGLKFKAKVDLNDSYVVEALLDQKIAYFEIKRRIFESGYRYYVTVVLYGSAPHKIDAADRDTSVQGGIDPGPSIIAFCTDKKAILKRLAPRSETYNREIRRLAKRAERMQRAENPGNYNPDGTIRNGKKAWSTSNNLQRVRRKIRVLHRRQSAYIKQSHCETANEIIRLCGSIVIEPNNFKALQKRSKKTEKSDKAITIQKADGTEKTILKNKRKKRFGHSIYLHSPALMIAVIKQKAEQYKIPVREVNISTYRASQYNPLTGEYCKSDISERKKQIGPYEVQRDLLSAFLIANPDKSLKHPDAKTCYEKFENFVKIQSAEISEMKAAHISYPQCFSF